jgi:REP element-mobilizing transposase RayT
MSAPEGRRKSVMPGTYSKLLFHVVFSTKHRAQLICDEVRPRLHEYMGGIIRSEKGVAHAVGGTPDHIHLLVGWRTDESLATLMRNLKANATRWVHHTFPAMESFRWQEGYAAFTVSASRAESVATYIRNQEQHHKSRSFEDKLSELLKAHGVDYDARYL